MMGLVRFLADHDLNDIIVDGVLRREPGIEILRVREIGMADRPDPEILQWAADNGLVIVSHDVNTMTAHAYDRLAQGQRMAGLLLVHQAESVASIIDSLVLIWSATEPEEWDGVVAFLPF